MPGIPCIYYGSEWGEEGEKAPDNDYALRPCFEAPSPNELTDFIRKLIAVRRTSDALCNGYYKNVVITNHQLVFERRTDQDRVLVAVNASDTPYTAGSGELQGEYTDLLNTDTGKDAKAVSENKESSEDSVSSGTVSSASAEKISLQGQLHMPPYSVQYLRFSGKKQKSHR